MLIQLQDKIMFWLNSPFFMKDTTSIGGVMVSRERFATRQSIVEEKINKSIASQK